MQTKDQQKRKQLKNSVSEYAAIKNAKDIFIQILKIKMTILLR